MWKTKEWEEEKSGRCSNRRGGIQRRSGRRGVEGAEESEGEKRRRKKGEGGAGEKG